MVTKDLNLGVIGNITKYGIKRIHTLNSKITSCYSNSYKRRRKNRRFVFFIYVIHDLILDDEEEKVLIMNTINHIDTEGLLRVKAVRTSQIDISIHDSKPQEYTINTRDIVKYETINAI